MKKRLQTLMILLMLTVDCFVLYAQELTATVKRPISHEDYDGWRSIESPKLSPDGKWISYLDAPQDGDAQLVAVRLSDKTTYHTGIGYTPLPGLDEGPESRPFPEMGMGDRDNAGGGGPLVCAGEYQGRLYR